MLRCNFMGAWINRAALAALVAIAACAGSTSDDEDSGTAPVDTGTAPPPDTAPPDPPPDTGPPPPACTDDDYADTCESATDLGSLLEGETISPTPGSLPEAGDEDWYRIDFPANPEVNTPGGGAPSVEIVVNEGDAFRFEVMDTCTTTLGCGEGMSVQDVDAWSFVDDQSMEGEEQWTTRDLPWPESVIIRVYRPAGAADCQRYRLSISR